MAAANERTCRRCGDAVGIPHYLEVEQPDGSMFVADLCAADARRVADLIDSTEDSR
ncbi:hypothetical protein [Haloplanus halophilus]|uniref:hypothetical protein n=1 Tax=Haloplanus halophilus TaxID=2949993 RepID=UPI00203EEF28|nr:hypothetical protein [Haloplanus sp. GDY1]